MVEEKKTASAQGEIKIKKPKHRSPNYPAIGLEKALERAHAIEREAGNHYIPIGVAYGIWKYQRSTGSQTVAALKSYGLIEVKGEKENRQIRLTDAARRILGRSPDYVELIKVAALKPDVHKEIWEKYGSSLPTDTVLRTYLQWERGFNKDAIDNFINQLRDTIEFAKLTTSDIIQNGSDNYDDDGDDGEDGMDANDLLRDKVKRTPPPVGTEHLFSYQLSFPRKIRAEVRIFGEDLKKQDIIRLSNEVKDLAKAFDEEVEQSAIWHNKELDLPVIVVGSPETGEDGRDYIAIKGSKSRIPYDEVEILES